MGRKCLALWKLPGPDSSGPPAKIQHSLRVTGLARFFGQRLFSSHVVGTWQPDPGLFLHAAGTLGFSPDQCVLVEDSEVGLAAAAAAGMRALHFAPKGPVSDASFTRMAELVAILEKIA